jgi:hypothetical protein
MGDRTAGPARARIVEMGDLEYESFGESMRSPRSMLIRFASEADLKRALAEGVVAVRFNPPSEPPP